MNQDPPRRRRKDLKSLFVQEPASDSAFFFNELAIDPPLEEFRRLFLKKTRSFETDRDSDKLDAYQRAYDLGESLIRGYLGDDLDEPEVIVDELLDEDAEVDRAAALAEEHAEDNEEFDEEFEDEGEDDDEYEDEDEEYEGDDADEEEAT